MSFFFFFPFKIVLTQPGGVFEAIMLHTSEVHEINEKKKKKNCNVQNILTGSVY